MSRRIMVSPAHLWTRSLRRASADAQRVALLIATCEARTQEGLFRLPVERIVMELGGGMTEDEVRAALDELHAAGLASYDDDAELVLWRLGLLDQVLQHGRGTDGQTAKNSAMKRAVQLVVDLPDSPLKGELARLAVDHAPDFAVELAAADPELRAVVQPLMLEEPTGRIDACVRCGELIPDGTPAMQEIGGGMVCAGCVPADSETLVEALGA